jgi:sulfite exporter TauE/SafE
MMMSLELLLIAFSIGLSGSAHCLAMCGGISSALSSGIKNSAFYQRLLRLVTFHLGRISCYCLIGVITGLLLQGVIGISKTAMFYTHLFALLMILLSGLYIAGFNPWLKKLEEKLAFIWKALQPTVQKFIAMENLRQAFGLGFIWGFLPCGMIYSTVLWASSATQSYQAGLLMFAFGLGTLPALLLINLGHQQLVQGFRKLQLNRVLGILLIIYAAISIAMKLTTPHGEHSHHSNQQQSQHNHHH